MVTTDGDSALNSSAGVLSCWPSAGGCSGCGADADGAAEALAAAEPEEGGEALATGGALAALSSVLGLDLAVGGVTVAWALGAAGLSGLLAGYYPARRATRVDVIAAVRAE